MGVESWKPDDYRWKEKKNPRCVSYNSPNTSHNSCPSHKGMTEGTSASPFSSFIHCSDVNLTPSRKKWPQKEGQKPLTSLDWIVLKVVPSNFVCHFDMCGGAPMFREWRQDTKQIFITDISSSNQWLICLVRFLNQHLITRCHCLCCLNNFWQIMKNPEQTLHLIKPKDIMFPYRGSARILSLRPEYAIGFSTRGNLRQKPAIVEVNKMYRHKLMFTWYHFHAQPSQLVTDSHLWLAQVLCQFFMHWGFLWTLSLCG